MKLLLVEDEIPKLGNLKNFVLENYPEIEIVTARSVRSAVDALRSGVLFDLILLDMSLPTFDIEPGENGGFPQGFGGLEVMRCMDRFDIAIPVIIVTAYEAFNSGARTLDLDDLRQEMQDQFDGIFRDLVYYNIVYGTWMENLRKAMDHEIKGISS